MKVPTDTLKNTSEAPAFSVVIPLYNKEATVARALRSVLNQSVQDFEIIVVNDGSSDNGPAVAQSMADPRIRLIHQENQGVSAARNHGIMEAKGELIAFLDADDEWLPGFLETILELARNHSQCSVYGTRYLFGMPDGRTRPCLIRGIEDGFSGVLDDYFAVAARSDPPIHSSAVVIRKRAINAVGGFPLGIKSGEDLLTWARLAISHGVAFSSKPQSIFTIRSEFCKPARSPEEIDNVGDGLQILLNQYPESNSLKQYMALWFKMRASQYLQNGRQVEALKELRKIRRFKSCDAPYCLYSIIALLPYRISKTVYSALCAAKSVRREMVSVLKKPRGTV